MKFVISIRKEIPKVVAQQQQGNWLLHHRSYRCASCMGMECVEIAWSRVKTMKTGLISVRRKNGSDTIGFKSHPSHFYFCHPLNVNLSTLIQIFVFGSNLAGIHGLGSAREAVLHHGAEYIKKCHCTFWCSW